MAKWALHVIRVEHRPEHCDIAVLLQLLVLTAYATDAYIEKVSVFKRQFKRGLHRVERGKRSEPVVEQAVFDVIFGECGHKLTLADRIVGGIVRLKQFAEFQQLHRQVNGATCADSLKLLEVALGFLGECYLRVSQVNDAREKSVIAGRCVLAGKNDSGTNKGALHLFVAVHILLGLTATAPNLFEKFYLAEVKLVLVLVKMHKVVLGA